MSTARRDAEVTRKVEAAKALLAENPRMPKAVAAREVGLPKHTLYDRLRADERLGLADDIVIDHLPETPASDAPPIFVRDYSDQPKHLIYPIGDLHIGAPQHADRALAEWLDYIRRAEYASMLNTGDNTNCALSSSVSDEYGEKLTVRQAREQQTEAFRPLADVNKIDAIIDGNHEDRVYRATGDTPNAAVAGALGLNYDRAHCIVRYIVGDQRYDVHMRHGSGGGGMMGSQVNNLEKQERAVDADIYVSGHTHTQVAFVKDRFERSGDILIRRKRLFVCSGSFVGYEEYAAQKGYPPAHIGAPRIYLDGRVHDMHASV